MSQNSFHVKKSLVLKPVTRPTSPENGEIYYDQTLNTFFRYQNGVWQQIGSGSGGVGINYLPFGGDFDAGITGWSAFNTTFSSDVPTSITMGSSKVAVSLESVAPLAGSGSLKFAVTTAASSTGHGVITDEMEIYDSDLARVFQASFDYWIKTNPSNFDLSGTSTSTFEMWVYNVGLASWYQPVGFRDALKSWAPDSMSVNFQSDYQNTSNKNKYRFAMIIKNDPAGVGDMLIDNAFFGRAFSSSNSSEEVNLKAVLGSNQSIPNGVQTLLNIDTVRIDTNGGFNVGTNAYVVKESGIYTIEATIYYPANSTGARGIYLYKNGSQFSEWLWPASSASGGNAVRTILFELDNAKAGDYYQIYAFQDSGGALNAIGVSGNDYTQVVIQKSSNGDASAEGGLVAFRATQNSNQSIPDSFATTIIWNNITIDTNPGAYNTLTGEWTCPESGKYLVEAGTFSDLFSWTVNQVWEQQLYINTALYSVLGETRAQGSTSINFSASGGDVVELKAGDVVELRVLQNRGAPTTVLANAPNNHFAITKISTNALNSNTRPVITASAALSTNQAWPTNTHTIVALDTALYDTGGLLNLGSNGFTIKESGYYRISGTLDVDNGTGVRAMFIVKNGTPGPVVTAQVGIFGSGFSNALNYYKEMHLNAGDLIQADAYQDAGTGATIIAGCTMTVTKM